MELNPHFLWERMSFVLGLNRKAYQVLLEHQILCPENREALDWEMDVGSKQR